MAAPAAIGNLGDIAGQVSGTFGAIVMVGFFILLIGGGAAFLYFGGLLTKRPYTCILFAPRNSGVKPFKVKGRELKNGEFEVNYGFMNNVKVQAPGDGAVFEGDFLFGYSPSKDEIYWIKDLVVNDTLLKADPVSSAASRQMYIVGVKEINDRFSMPNQMKEWGIIGAIFILALAVGLGSYFGNTKVAEAFDKSTGGIASKLDRLLSHLDNSTILIERREVVANSNSVGSSSSPPGNPSPRNPPPG